MKFALFGYGRMGKLVEQAVKARGHQVVAIIDSPSSHPNIAEADICVDFSVPEHVLKNVALIAKQKKNIILGTTGWESQADEIFKIVQQAKIGLLHSPNFSIGAQLFYKIVARAAALFEKMDNYEVGGFEWHHGRKTDSPSGTARQLGTILTQNMERKTSVNFEPLQRPVKKEEIHFASLRSGYNPGMHTVIFDSEQDSITLTHQARNRMGFAYGAVIAAEWLRNQTGIFTLDDVLT